MPNLTVRNIPKDTYRMLKKRAKARRHSLNAEILAILSSEDAWERRRLAMEEALPRIEKLRAEIAKRHPVKYETYELIREGRNI